MLLTLQVRVTEPHSDTVVMAGSSRAIWGAAIERERERVGEREREREREREIERDRERVNK